MTERGGRKGRGRERRGKGKKRVPVGDEREGEGCPNWGVW